MTQQWHLESTKGRCAVSGRELVEGEPFHTVLFEDGESFRRVDIADDAWTGPPEGCYSHFRTKVPIRQKRKRVFVDNEILIGFFQRLEGDQQPLRVQFRFVLALILMRKRLLRYEESAPTDHGDLWTMTLLRDHTTHQVLQPSMTDDTIAAVSEKLGAVLHEDLGEWSHDLDTNLTSPQ